MTKKSSLKWEKLFKMSSILESQNGTQLSLMTSILISYIHKFLQEEFKLSCISQSKMECSKVQQAGFL